jgi:pimeloyl-ACP methyl ester carboxylesterase
MKVLKRVILGAVGIYLAALLYVFIMQRSFMYLPDTNRPPADFARRNGVEIVSIDVDGIGELQSIYAAAPTDAPIVLYFHGNGSSAFARTAQFSDIKSWGYGFLAAEYPGYGGNIGAPSQTDIFKTALANYDWLLSQGYAPDHIVIYGHSLGAASAVYTAREREAAGLVLSAPFISMLAMGHQQMPFFPVRILLKDTYRSDTFIRDVTEPVLVIHGNADNTVPYDMGRELFEIYGGEKQFVTVEGGRHYLWATDMPNYLLGFVGKVVP